MSAKTMIYMDAASMYPVLPCALDAFNDAVRVGFGNPSSGHARGQNAKMVLEGARARVAKCIGAEPEEIVFTSGSTEACNLAMYSLGANCAFVRRGDFEHHAVMGDMDAKSLAATGFTLPCPTREYGCAQMLVNNETGKIFDMPVRKNETDLIFSDLTAAIGHIPVNVKELGIDYGAFGAHKFGGIPGAGALYVKSGSPFTPMIQGGGQEAGRRAGTESVALACAMAAALEWQTEHMVENMLKVRSLFLRMYDRFFVFSNGGAERILFNGFNNLCDANVSPYIMNVSFPGIEGGALALRLSERGVIVGTGSACTTGDNKPSRVLMAIYDNEERARSAIRISFHHGNTLADADRAAGEILCAVRDLREIMA